MRTPLINRPDSHIYEQELTTFLLFSHPEVHLLSHPEVHLFHTLGYTPWYMHHLGYTHPGICTTWAIPTRRYTPWAIPTRRYTPWAIHPGMHHLGYTPRYAPPGLYPPVTHLGYTRLLHTLAIPGLYTPWLYPGYTPPGLYGRVYSSSLGYTAGCTPPPWTIYRVIHHLGYIPGYTPPGYIYHPGYTLHIHCLLLYLYHCTPSRAVLVEEALGSEKRKPVGGRHSPLSGPQECDS